MATTSDMKIMLLEQGVGDDMDVALTNTHANGKTRMHILRQWEQKQQREGVEE